MSMIGSGLGGSVTDVRMYLKAESADALVRLQLLNNIKYKSHFGYTDFAQSPVDKFWYCWFLISVDLIEQKSVIKKPKLNKKK